jgi:hypothetical protein
MATLPRSLFRGAATTTLTTALYSTPANTTTILTNIIVTNTSNAAQTFDLSIGSVKIAALTPIAANSIATFDVKQVLSATTGIQGGASSTAVNFHIAGVEVS